MVYYLKHLFNFLPQKRLTVLLLVLLWTLWHGCLESLELSWASFPNQAEICLRYHARYEHVRLNAPWCPVYTELYVSCMPQKWIFKICVVIITKKDICQKKDWWGQACLFFFLCDETTKISKDEFLQQTTHIAQCAPKCSCYERHEVVYHSHISSFIYGNNYGVHSICVCVIA